MRRKRSTTHSSARSPRPARRICEDDGVKVPELTSCPRCRATFRDGRWTWQPATAGAHEHVCPACERIEANYPAGVLHVAGRFAQQHRDDVIGLLRNIEERERSEHALKRIIEIQDEDAGFAVTTTDAKLVEAFGRALEKAYAGKLEHPRTTSEKQNLVRVRWARD
jgi:NMD protein affecting ribosome stability and mRNA decay